MYQEKHPGKIHISAENPLRWALEFWLNFYILQGERCFDIMTDRLYKTFASISIDTTDYFLPQRGRLVPVSPISGQIIAYV
jgi:hypothetical protein